MTIHKRAALFGGLLLAMTFASVHAQDNAEAAVEADTAPSTQHLPAAGPAGERLQVGVVDVARVVNESPQAARAKSSMATQFAKRKNDLEAQANGLRQDVDRLSQDGTVMSDGDRETLQTEIRDRQRELQMQRSKYNDDVADAEQKEFEQMREDILEVIDQYAEANGYDLILGDGVLYSSDTVDVTDEILAELEEG